ncbi:probable cytochrome P450 CYP44 [Gigantopelta aegis]|uniref:probable cytochrome P450 CYP44 n=1 Tax=Gigantopelta aegis TaxID=1735272 RepID=UPI001B88D121|nr:probable cytochrome P450 CYP44 [Gigantopelta aegis]
MTGKKIFSSKYVNVLKASARWNAGGIDGKQPELSTVMKQVNPDVKPFSEIPGPRGLPFVGSLLYYKTGRHSVERFPDALMERFQTYGNISKERFGTETVVRLFDPRYIQDMYKQEGKYPAIPPLIEASKNYREFKGMSPGLGNV